MASPTSSSSSSSASGGGSFLSEYLNAALNAVKSLSEDSEVSQKMSSKMKSLIQTAQAALTDAQRVIGEKGSNLSSSSYSSAEKLRSYFEDAWNAISQLKTEIINSSKETSSASKEKLLNYITTCQLALQQFQGRLVDKFNLEVSLEALLELKTQIEVRLRGCCELFTNV